MGKQWKHGDELERVEVGTNYANLRGYFVSVSVIRDDGGSEWIDLTPDEAETLARRLTEMAAIVRKAPPGATS